MTLRVCPDSSPCLPDQPLDNFSSEADDGLDFISTFFGGTPPPLFQDWDATACGQTFISFVSQADADLQAAAAAALCTFNHNNPNPPPNFPILFNSPQTCCVPCSDGTKSCYTVPGGLFPSLNQADADAQAMAVACALVEKNKVCISGLVGSGGCTCVGSSFVSTLSSVVPVSWSIIGGSIPPGMTFSGGIGNSTVISGIPNTPGQYTFQVQGQTATGTTSTKVLTITVLAITTLSLPPFSIGTPYSFQMQVTGGGGNYAWKITSGALPAGLTMSLTGLISGTPTSAGTNPLVFSVIDQTCEAADQSFFPPHVAMTTKSTTQIATVRGYSEYQEFLSTPPKKYKTLTWAGFGQWIYTLPNGTTWQTFEWDYNGSGNIDEFGNKTSSYTKIKSHSYFPNPLQSVGDFAGDSIHDSIFPQLTIMPAIGGQFTVLSGSFAQAVGASTVWSEDPNDPNNTFEGLPGAFTFPQPPSFAARLDGNFNYSATLSNQYTDSEALANAQVVVGNGATAANLQRTTGFVSTFVNVVYTLSMSNLIVGTAYTVSVDFWNTSTGVTTTNTIGFQANATTNTIVASVPLPPAQQLIQVRNPKIAFA